MKAQYRWYERIFRFFKKRLDRIDAWCQTREEARRIKKALPKGTIIRCRCKACLSAVPEGLLWTIDYYDSISDHYKANRILDMRCPRQRDYDYFEDDSIGKTLEVVINE